MSILCRACGEPIYNVNPRNLFRHENNDIRRNIEDITGIKLTYDLQMPSHICSCCYLDLEHSISFRTRCLETHAQLMNEKLEPTFNSQVLSTKLEPIDPLDSRDDNEEEYAVSKHEEFEEFLDCSDNANEVSPREDTPPVEKSRQYLSSKVSNKYHKKRTRPTLLRVTDVAKDVLPVSTSHKSRLEVRKPKEKQPYTDLEKNFVCDVCGWSFRDISNLKSHALRHSGEKKFKCMECDRQFFDNPQLRLHVRVHHKGEKPFVCKYCGMAFRNSPTRCRHERKFHANQLPFECDLCSRTFITQISLNSHKLVHVTGEKIHHCATCNKTFKEVGSLRKHYSTQFHQKRFSRLIKDDCDLNSLEIKVLDDEDIDFNFSDSIIEEVDE
ncbi:zinc finger protein 184-like [Drosophila innubila]|uniref:zinc finger protein 184-like n=1 Tax=Drosophila innubila TaxID=198719 RepID=UPI00148E6209|nr:zinc finger protein 184-like [Drosophila innubila]